MSTNVTPCLESVNPKDRFVFYQARIKTVMGPFLVFQEIRPDDLEDLLNELDKFGFEIFELQYEASDPGHRGRWTLVAFRTREAA